MANSVKEGEKKSVPSHMIKGIQRFHTAIQTETGSEDQAEWTPQG